MSPVVLAVVSIAFINLQFLQAHGSELLLNCGSNGTVDADGRRWNGDIAPGSNFTLSSPGFAASLTGNSYTDEIFGPVYRSARFFNLTSWYHISVLPGNYCIRLHFFPSTFGNFSANNSVFDVTASGFKLVSKFNVSEEIVWRSSASNSVISAVVKEYFLVIGVRGLQIEFDPSPGSFAFVTAIEVMLTPDNLFNDTVNKVGGAGEQLPLGLSNRGVETMYRLNIGGPALKSSSDQYLHRPWYTDEAFMFSTNAAQIVSNASSIMYVSSNDSLLVPIDVYETARIMGNNMVVDKRFNVSWRFYVHPNFDYLVRLHFCELVYDKPNQRIFKIYINNKTAAENYDVYVRAGGINKAYHEDYFDDLPLQADSLWLQLGPDSMTSASGTDALLNGLEIFKLSKNGNLAYVLGHIDMANQRDSSKGKKKIDLWEEVGIGSASFVVLTGVFLFSWCYIRKKRKAVDKEAPPGWHPLVLHEAMKSTTDARAASKSSLARNASSIGHRMGRRFSIAEIRAATKNFDESLVIGTGGFGKVYKGELGEGTTVAIKRANPLCGQGLKEFETEIEMLSKLRHRHLVAMIGYCEEQKEMILVYEYMAKGTLRSHLYGNGLSPLTWKQRIDACIGAARGLHYLHTGADRGIIHRDVKTTNILLDDNFVAKIADFGLSKTGPTLDQTHVSTAVKGSFGYLDPEYFRRQQLTQKSDVYSFGVVLFEVACARPVIDPTLPKDQINLAEWAMRWQRQRSLEAIMDPRLDGDFSSESLKKFGEIVEKCLADDGRSRPSMGEVLWHLEYVLQLHETYKRNVDSESFGSGELRFADISFSLPHIGEGEEELHSKPSSIREELDT
ncbi:probable receptor-like protein kinase At1g30570 [Phragmites australis]|uniref:probable receptor-like protein kinase At1g30570 n=1 Tax=Phragmites australis TaxID=29695 RepID=UPI002D77F6BA|nr:probable receptor-like protein kinase At1g30570 [Phragmites australis]XP_062226758.1 probable receptor-like protein kinase At1g30570 [Phragmites australis]